ncbi:hypothetical protein Gotur_008622 [Gossypium turneri]
MKMINSNVKGRQGRIPVCFLQLKPTAKTEGCNRERNSRSLRFCFFLANVLLCAIFLNYFFCNDWV